MKTIKLIIRGIEIIIVDKFNDGIPMVHFKCGGERASKIYDYLIAEGFISK